MAFLLWVAGRSASVALENNAGILMKIVGTILSLVSLYQFNVALSWVDLILKVLHQSCSSQSKQC